MHPFRLKVVLVVVAVMTPVLQADAQVSRWYTEEDVLAGRELFETNCVACHGAEARGIKDWKKRDAAGNLPPPPLNGTAHTWHHDLETLRRTVREGNAKLGGTMPAFGGRLNAEDVDDVLAYVQSLWPEELYEGWAARFPVEANAGRSSESRQPSVSGADQPPAESKSLTELLSRRVAPGTKLEAPEETPVSGIYGVQAGSRYLYVDETGRYAFVGNLIDLRTGANLSEKKREAVRRDKMSSFAEVDKVVYPAQGEQKGQLDVFTDTTCPYCRKLHQEVPKLQAAGVTVRYLPFPRSGETGRGYDEMRSVWCADDRPAAMDEAKSGSPYLPGETSCQAAEAVGRGYALGLEVGVTGTPAIVLTDGRLIPGYRPYRDLLRTLRITAN